MGSPSTMKSDDKLLRKRLNARMRQQRCRARKRAVQKKHQEIQQMRTPKQQLSSQQKYLDNDIVSNALQRHLEIKPNGLNTPPSNSRRCSISSSMLDTSSNSDSSVLLSGQSSPSNLSRDSLPRVVRTESFHTSKHHQVVSPVFDQEDELRHTAIDAMLSLRNVFYKNAPAYPMDAWRAKNAIWSRVVPKWNGIDYSQRFEDRPHYVPVPIGAKNFGHVRYMYPY